MRATEGTSTPTSRVRGRRALALAVALAIPLLSACGPDATAGFGVLTTTPGDVVHLLGGTPEDGEPDSAPVQLDGPRGVAVNQGVRYVADTGHQRVLRIARDGSCVLAGAAEDGYEDLEWCAGAAPDDRLQRPTALAVTEMGDVFIADELARRVFVVASGSRELTVVAGDQSDGQPVDGAFADETPLVQPTGLAVTSDGDQLYIADAGARRVLVVDTSEVATPLGSLPTRVPSGTSSPSGLTSSPPSMTVSPMTSSTSSAGSSSSPSGGASASGESTPSAATSSPSASSSADDAEEVTADDRVRLLAAEVDESAPGSGAEQDADGGSGEDGELEPGDLPESDGHQPDGSTDGSTDDGVDDGEDLLPAEEAPSPGAPELSTAGRLFVLTGTGCAPGTASDRPAQGEHIGSLSAALSRPVAVALDGSRLFVADSDNHQVYAVSPGAVDEERDLVAISTDAPASPSALAVVTVSSSQHLVALDASNRTLLQAPALSAPVTWRQVTEPLTDPSALAGDRSSVLFTDATDDSLAGVSALGPVVVPSPDETSADTPVVDLSTTEPASFTPLALVEPSETDTDRPVRRVVTTPCAATTGAVPSQPSGDRDLTPQAVPSPARPKVPSQVDVPDAGSHRFSGKDRVATSVDTSKELFPTAGSVPVVVISSASSYADAAGGARYAAEVGGSLLLTPGRMLDPAVEAEVRRTLAPGGTILVTGREAAITAPVFSALEKIAPGRTERVGGEDRYETATKLAQKLAGMAGVPASGPIYLVTGANYPDALVVVSLARRTGGLIVLSKEGELPPVTKALLQTMDPTGVRTVPVGGAAAKAAASLGGDAGRTAAAAAVVGSDRYDTARRVAERFVALDAAAGARTEVVGIATGTDWPDALVGSTAMGSLVGPLLLNHGGDLDPNVVRALAAIPSSTRPTTTVVFGGEKAVPASVLQAFATAAKG